MRVEKMVQIVLNEEEMKRAVYFWLDSQVGRNRELLYHMTGNDWIIEVNEDGEFVVCIDGIFEKEEK